MVVQVQWTEGTKNRMAFAQIATLVFEGLLGLFAAYSAYSLFTWTPPSIAKAREALRYPHWYWLLAGVVATIGAAGLLLGPAFPQVAALAAVWMVAYFIVATCSHLVRRDWANVGMPLIFLVLFALLVVVRWGNVASLLSHL